EAASVVVIEHALEGEWRFSIKHVVDPQEGSRSFVAHQISQVVTEVQTGKVHRADISDIGAPQTGVVLNIAVVDWITAIPAPIHGDAELVFFVVDVPERLPVRAHELPGGIA